MFKFKHFSYVHSVRCNKLQQNVNKEHGFKPVDTIDQRIEQMQARLVSYYYVYNNMLRKNDKV